MDFVVVDRCSCRQKVCVCVCFFCGGSSYGSPVLWLLVFGCCAFLGLPILVTLFWGAFFWPTFGAGLQEHKGASLMFGSPTLEKHAPPTTRGWCRRLLTGCFHHPSWTFRCPTPGIGISMAGCFFQGEAQNRCNEPADQRLLRFLVGSESLAGETALCWIPSRPQVPKT